jgi:CAAX protease family protein
LVTPSIPQPTEVSLPKQPLSRPPREPAWGIFDVLVLGALTFLAIYVLAALFLVPVLIHQNLPAGQPLPLTTAAKAVIPAELVAYVLLLIIAKSVLGTRGHPNLLQAVQWNWLGWKKSLVLIGLALACAVAVLMSGLLFNIPPDLPIEVMLKDKLVANMFLLFGILPAPFVEEFYFRGLLYPALQRRLGAAAAVILTAAAFAGLHASQLAGAMAPIVILFAVGLVLTLIRAMTGSVAAAFVFHVTYNAALFMLDAFAK